MEEYSLDRDVMWSSQDCFGGQNQSELFDTSEDVEVKHISNLEEWMEERNLVLSPNGLELFERDGGRKR